MIWTQNVKTVVMVTGEVESGALKCHRYWPDPTSSPPTARAEHGAVTVSHVRTEHHDDHVLRIFDIQAGRAPPRRVHQLAYTGWPDHGAPATAAGLLGFRRAVRDSQRAPGPPDTTPIAVHCSAGVGRTGTFIAIDRLLEQVRDQRTGLSVDAVIRVRHPRLLCSSSFSVVLCLCLSLFSFFSLLSLTHISRMSPALYCRHAL